MPLFSFEQNFKTSGAEEKADEKISIRSNSTERVIEVRASGEPTGNFMTPACGPPRSGYLPPPSHHLTHLPSGSMGILPAWTNLLSGLNINTSHLSNLNPAWEPEPPHPPGSFSFHSVPVNFFSIGGEAACVKLEASKKIVLNQGRSMSSSLLFSVNRPHRSSPGKQSKTWQIPIFQVIWDSAGSIRIWMHSGQHLYWLWGTRVCYGTWYLVSNG